MLADDILAVESRLAPDHDLTRLVAPYLLFHVSEYLMELVFVLLR